MSSSNTNNTGGPPLPPPARARLSRELSRLSSDPPPGVAAYAPHGPTDPSYLRAQITGPPSTPYAGGIFLVTIRFTSRYPFEPPRVRFVTPVHHPNVDCAGRICLDTLKQPPAGSWSPAVSLPSLLTTLRTLLGDPNPDDALVPEIADMYKTNPRRFEEEAREWTAREATEAKCLVLERRLDGDAGAGEGGGGVTEKKENAKPKAEDDDDTKLNNPASDGTEGGDDDDVKKAAPTTTTCSTATSSATAAASSAASTAATGKRTEAPSAAADAGKGGGKDGGNDDGEAVREGGGGGGGGGGKRQKVEALEQ